jgi:hypothetical protein
LKTKFIIAVGFFSCFKLSLLTVNSFLQPFNTPLFSLERLESCIMYVLPQGKQNDKEEDSGSNLEPRKLLDSELVVSEGG